MICTGLFIACQKELSSKTNKDAFNANAAKEWYYGTFKKTPEWIHSGTKGKQLPDWKHASTGKIKNAEAVEFPFIKGSASFMLPSDNSLSVGQKKRIANGSLSRIMFIKSGNDILVREVDYIPDWSYLEKRQFDISGVSLVKENDFTGRIVVKNWNGVTTNSAIYENGKAIKVTRSKTNNPGTGKNNRIEEESCTYYELCIWQQDCVLTIYGDGMMTNECGEWFNTNECWTEEVCNETDPCVIVPEACGGEGDDPPDGCENQDCSVAESMLAGITAETNNDVTNSIGSEIGPDANGIIKRRNDPKWSFFKLNLSPNQYIRFTANFTGWVYRLHTGSIWKWLELSYHHTSRTGNTPPCVDVEQEVNCIPPIISLDEKKATVPIGGLNWNIDVTIQCIMLSFRSRNFTDANSLDMEFLASY